MTPNERVVQKALELLEGGPMGNPERGDFYQAFLERTFGKGKQLRTKRTSCAIFAGGVCIDSGVQGKRGWPRVNAITTWLGVQGFFGATWVTEGELLPGDIVYWCSTAGKMGDYTWTKWPDAADGHVGILIKKVGDLWLTAEGGGSPGGTMCRLSAAPKDISKSSNRPRRGVWRPNNMPSAETEPAGPPKLPITPGTKGDGRVRQWQRRLLNAGYSLPKFGADDHFSDKPTSETGVATVQLQSVHGLPLTGIVDFATWEAAQPL